MKGIGHHLLLAMSLKTDCRKVSLIPLLSRQFWRILVANSVRFLHSQDLMSNNDLRSLVSKHFGIRPWFWSRGYQASGGSFGCLDGGQGGNSIESRSTQLYALLYDLILR